MSTVALPIKKIEPAVKSADRMDGNTIVDGAFSLATGRMAVLSDSQDAIITLRVVTHHAQFHMTFAVATRLAADNS